MTNGNAATRRWRHPVGLYERFFVVKLLILKRVKISESTDMLREVSGYPGTSSTQTICHTCHIELA
jgi:hypothetical protein